MKQIIAVNINGIVYEGAVEPRMLLCDFIRHDARLTGTHVGCEHGVCGACTVHLDGEAVRSCTILAIQADKRSLRTVEDLAAPNGEMHPLQQALHEVHGLQCGFCTPGILMALEPLVAAGVALDDSEIREALSGNLCRCTGYHQIVQAVRIAISRVRGDT